MIDTTETEQTLSLLQQAVPAALQEPFSYFLTLGSDYEAPCSGASGPHFVILGAGFPFEFLPVMPKGSLLWIPSGSSRDAMLADEYLPRDADPVTRGILGHVLRNADFLRGALFLIPLYSDNMVKLPAVLESLGFRTQCLAMPAASGGKRAAAALGSSLAGLRRSICLESRRIYFRDDYRRRMTQLELRYRGVSDFCAAADAASAVFPGLLRMYILNTWYLTTEKNRWLKQLGQLTAAISGLEGREGAEEKPGILLAGSPVYFPNYKLCGLIADSGLDIAAQLDFASAAMTQPPAKTPGDWLERDCSPAHTVSEALQARLRELVSRGNVRGVIWHILKGQIEYDFELSRFEAVCAGLQLPVLRVETDYSNQDIEQLRIRIEAFSEMLRLRGGSPRQSL